MNNRVASLILLVLALPAIAFAQQRVFVTSTSQQADYGGLSGADNLCQTRANAANLGGTWVAWLSDTTTHALARVLGDGPFVRLDGEQIASSKVQLFDGSLENSISIDEFGVFGGGGVYTGTTIFGTGAGGTYCGDYTIASGTGHPTAHGLAHRNDSAWTNNGPYVCGAQFRLYCFEQPLPPSLTKSFSPTNIPAGGTSTLAFTIDNSATTEQASDLAFNDNFPSGLVVANPANATITGFCGGTWTATPGATTVSYAGGSVGATQVCTLNVNVTSVANGVYPNVTSVLATSLGDSVGASATLAVGQLTPLFTKNFAPGIIAPGGISTLTFTIDNTGAVVPLTSGLNFSDDLPSGVVIATPDNSSNTCGGTLTVDAVASQVALVGGSVLQGSVCTINVDVTSATVGTYVNNTSSLDSSEGPAAPAAAGLAVGSSGLPLFSKSFVPNVIAPDDISTMTFTIDNTENFTPVPEFDFTDDLPVGVVIATPSNISNNCGGTLTTAGTQTIDLADGSVLAGAGCTITVDVTSATVGVYVNTTGELVMRGDNSAPAIATLTVGAPEMDVQGNSVSIADGDTTPSTTDDTDFGSLDISAPAVAHTFTIENTGNVDLNLTGSPRVTVSGPHAADFSVTAQPAATVTSGGGTTIFVVSFDSSAVGLRSATLSIANDDTDENPYNFDIQGTRTQGAVSVPTLSPWGLLMLSLLFGAVALLALRRNQWGQ